MGGGGVGRGVPHGASSLYLASGVSFLNEEEAVSRAMVEGWSMQQLGGRNLRESSVDGVVRVVTRFQEFTGEWPWQWTAAGFDEWMTHLVSVRRLAPSTIRGYQQAVRSFCEFICSEHYGWARECEQRFGTHPVQVCHEWNTVAHLQDYEGRPGRRPLTREELQRLLDRADAEVEARLGTQRKGALPAYRDATLLKVVYAWGLRANEAVHLDVTDFYRNPHGPGVWPVRHGAGPVREGDPRWASEAAVGGVVVALGGRRGRGLCGQRVAADADRGLERVVVV
jgi:hypothetical protein